MFAHRITERLYFIINILLNLITTVEKCRPPTYFAPLFFFRIISSQVYCQLCLTHFSTALFTQSKHSLIDPFFAYYLFFTARKEILSIINDPFVSSRERAQLFHLSNIMFAFPSFFPSPV